MFYGCNNSNITSPVNEQSEINITDSNPYYEFNITIKQIVGASSNTIVNQTIYPTSVGLSNPVNFTTLRSRDGNSTFTIERTMVWSKPIASHGVFVVSQGTNTILATANSTPAPSGNYYHIMNINLQEGTTYNYQMGPEVVNEDTDD
jgi:hypothetical protein